MGEEHTIFGSFIFILILILIVFPLRSFITSKPQALGCHHILPALVFSYPAASRIPSHLLTPHLSSHPLASRICYLPLIIQASVEKMEKRYAFQILCVASWIFVEEGLLTLAAKYYRQERRHRRQSSLPH